MPTTSSPRIAIVLLGVLSVVSPFAIDMYLGNFPKFAEEFDVPTNTVALTISSYFIGLALGQVVYGPLLDRFGRKRPLSVGLALFMVAGLACTQAPTIEILIALRFVQGIGGCVAQVASVAMVRDFFPANAAARILSRLFLFIAVSPLLAPTIGGEIIALAGWRAAFIVLTAVVAAILAAVLIYLPEGHTPDPEISLAPGPILAEYFAILSHPRFATYAFAGAFSFAGLFTYVAGAPILLRDGFGVGEREFNLIFAVMSVGFIGASQANIVLLRRFTSETLFLTASMIQVVIGAVFLAGMAAGWWDLWATLVLFFVFLACVGITNPNASGLAVGPFSRNAGSAAALLGFFQLGIGAVISTGIAGAKPKDGVPIIAILAVTSLIGLGIVLFGRKRASRAAVDEQAGMSDEVPAMMH